jgi:hypothetical protein
MSLFIARIVIILPAKSEAEASDCIAETMREVCSGDGLIDWSYSRDEKGFTKPFYVDPEYLNISQIYDLSAANQR